MAVDEGNAAIAGQINTLERKKFDLDANGNVIVRTSATGSFTPSGMTDFTTTVVSVGTSAVKLPSIALSGRISISIHNKSSSATLYIGKSSVTADDASTGGWEVAPQMIQNIDFAGAIDVYGISTETITVKIIEYK